MTDIFSHKDNVPKTTKETPRVVTMYLDGEFFQPTLIDHRTGKVVDYTMIDFDTYKPGQTTLTGVVYYEDGDSWDTFYAVLDWGIE